MVDSNVKNWFKQPSLVDNDNVLNIGGTTSFTKDAIIQVEGDPALGESDYEARWAEFVKGVFSGGARITSTAAANYTILNSDYLIFADATSNAIDAQLPPAADFYDAANNIGYSVQVKKIDASANTVDMVATIPELVEGLVKLTLSGLGNTYEVVSDGTGWWVK
jgi:hypothetical protein